jgi:hypothetical protein
LAGSGTASLTISGSLGAVSTALGTLSDNDSTTGSDSIVLNATDSFGNVATQTTTAITVNGLPVITAPTAKTIGVSKATSIPGGSLSESGTTAGETFTVTVADTHGLLSATAGGAALSGNGTASLTISGSLSAVSTALGTLSDNDSTTGSDSIVINATDSFGNVATQTTTAVTVNGLPVITTPGAATIGVGQTGLITGGSLAETGTTTGETFTVTVADTHGLLSVTAGGATLSGNGTASLTISGALAAVSSALGTLSDNDSTSGSDSIVINATDSFGNVATQTTTAITVNTLPSISAPTTATVAQNVATGISSVSVSETGNTTTSGETFTAVLSDSNGVLSATASGGTVTPSNGGKTLTISGTLAQVNADLATLADDDTSTASDTISVNASDSFGNSATQKSIAVTVTPASGALAIGAPTTATVGVGQTDAIVSVSISESPTTGGETFTVVLADSHGVLSANTGGIGGGGTIASSNSGKTLTVSGTLTQVNADLATLTDNDASTASDTITINAGDSNGATAGPSSIVVTVNTAPVLTAPAAKVIGVSKATPIPGGSLAETGNTSGETFSVTLSDSNGLLSVTAGGATLTGNGSKSLTISGSLSVVSTALGTLSDTDATAGSDSITLNASDSLGNAATQVTTAITVNGLPVLAAPTTATITQSVLTAITGVGLSETGTTTGETFTVTLTDSNGLLATSNAGGATVNGGGSTSLTISGQLAAVTTALSNLDDTDATTPSDSIVLNATDSFGNVAVQKTIAVTVQPPTGQTYTLTKGVDTVNGNAGANTVNATTNTLSAGDQINAGSGGSNALDLIGAGIFNLSLPTTLTGIQVVNAQEGQGGYGAIAGTNQSITLRSGLNVTVDVTAATINGSNPKAPTITINGANDSSVIDLASGNDVVTLGSASETVNGGSGNDQIQVTAATIGATINGGTGSSTLYVLGGGSNITMGSSITHIANVVLGGSPGAMSFIANSISGLTVNDENTGADTVTAGGASQTLTGGNGADTFVGLSSGSTTFEDATAAMNGDTITNFFAANSKIDLTDMNFASLQTPTFSAGKLTVTDGSHTAVLTLTGSAPGGTFVTHQDSGIGTLISYQVGA